MLSGEEIDHSLRKRWLRKRGSDFQGRPCLDREVGNSVTFFKECKMKNLTFRNQVAFIGAFIITNIFCTWLVLALGALL